MDQCAVCGVYGLPTKMVGSARMCFDQIGCAKRKQARINDDDDRFLITPLEGPPDPNVPHVTVDCSRADCRMSFFIARTDPRLPDGPFLCPDHDDNPTKFKAVGHTELTVFCDRCEAHITVEGATREEAIDKLRALIREKHWKVIDRFDGPVSHMAQLTGAASSTVTAPDLCGDCASQR